MPLWRRFFNAERKTEAKKKGHKATKKRKRARIYDSTGSSESEDELTHGTRVIHDEIRVEM